MNRGRPDLVAGDANQQEHANSHRQTEHGQPAIPNFGLGSKAPAPGIELTGRHLIRSSVRPRIDWQADLLNVNVNVLWIDLLIELGHRDRPMPYAATLEGLKAGLGVIEAAGLLQRQPGGNGQLHRAPQSR
jgi:hypothetical protein